MSQISERFFTSQELTCYSRLVREDGWINLFWVTWSDGDLRWWLMDGHCSEMNSKCKLLHHWILRILFFFEKNISLMTKCKFTNPFIVIWKNKPLYRPTHYTPMLQSITSYIQWHSHSLGWFLSIFAYMTPEEMKVLLIKYHIYMKCMRCHF